MLMFIYYSVIVFFSIGPENPHWGSGYLAIKFIHFYHSCYLFIFMLYCSMILEMNTYELGLVFFSSYIK